MQTTIFQGSALRSYARNDTSSNTSRCYSHQKWAPESRRPGFHQGSSGRSSQKLPHQEQMPYTKFEQTEPFNIELFLLLGLPCLIIFVPSAAKDPAYLAFAAVALAVPGTREIIVSVTRDLISAALRAPFNKRTNQRKKPRPHSEYSRRPRAMYYYHQPTPMERDEDEPGSIARSEIILNNHRNATRSLQRYDDNDSLDSTSWLAVITALLSRVFPFMKSWGGLL